MQEINIPQYRKLFHLHSPLIFFKKLSVLWGFYRCFDHIHPYYPDLSRFMPIPLWSKSVVLCFPIKADMCFLNTRRQTGFHWSITDFSGTILLAKTNSFSTCRQQLPVVPWLGMQLDILLVSPGLGWHSSSACCYNGYGIINLIPLFLLLHFILPNIKNDPLVFEVVCGV